MHAHYFQHVPFEGLGSIETWLSNKGYELSSTQFFQSCDLPDPAEVDLLIVLGGPMSVNDVVEHLWLEDEKAFIRHFIATGKPVLGICLGAQLIASAMGGDVYPNDVKEIGWFPVQGFESTTDSLFHFPSEQRVFHWHGETFTLPEGAVHLAQSKACKHQAFQLGTNVIGLQFHLETTPASARAIVEHCGDELVAGDYIQSADTILSASEHDYAAINALMAQVLDFLHKTLTGLE